MHFRHAGGAPILKKPKGKFLASLRIYMVAEKLRELLQLQRSDPLFLFCNNAFAPPPDQLLGDVAEGFSVDGVLTLNYCITPAWG